MFKIIVRLKPYRQYKEKALGVYEEHGLLRMQEFCVVSHINLAAMYSLLLEELDDDIIRDSLKGVLDFYGYEVVE